MNQNFFRRLYGWACERLYAEFAWSYDVVSWLVSLGRWNRWRMFALDYVRGTRILEIGFGTGELLSCLAEGATGTVGVTVGLELSPAMHRQTARKLFHRGVTLPRVQARAQAMPFCHGAFNTIIVTFPAPYILEPATLRECARLLSSPTNGILGGSSSGGRLVIVGLWVALDHVWWGRFVPLFYGRPSPLGLARLSAQLAAVGFRPIICERADGPVRVGVVVAEHRGDPAP